MLLDLTTEETLALYHHLHKLTEDDTKYDERVSRLVDVYCKIDNYVVKKLQENTTDPVKESGKFSEPSHATWRQFDKWYAAQLSKVVKLQMENAEINGDVRKAAKKPKKK